MLFSQALREWTKQADEKYNLPSGKDSPAQPKTAKVISMAQWKAAAACNNRQ